MCVFMEVSMSELSEKWDQITETVRNEGDVTDISFETWIKPLKVYGIVNDTVIIIVPPEKDRLIDYYNKRYLDFFRVAISETLNHTYDVEFKVEKDIDSKESSSETNVYNINFENANLDSRYKFSSFVVGGNNQLAHSAALAVAESPGRAYNPLFIYGGSGLGKTHLMHAIGHYILEQNPNMKVLYVSSAQFTDEIVESLRSGNAASAAKVREKYRSVDVLMIDDVQFIIGKEATQIEFFNTFNALHSSGKAIILSSDKAPSMMESLDERFRSRFGWGLAVDIQPPEYETRMAILMKKAASCDIKIDKAIIEYIASNINTNIRDLEGAFNKIMLFSKLNKGEVTLQLAEEALRDVIYPDRPFKVTPSYIIDVVAEHFKIKPEVIVSKKKSADVVTPRHIAMYLCCEMTDASLNDIGSALGNRDHTTVMNGRDNVTKKIKENIEFSNTIDVIKSKISH